MGAAVDSVTCPLYPQYSSFNTAHHLECGNAGIGLVHLYGRAEKIQSRA
ncbi:MAG: hypothetical protein QOH85_262 [Acidobacteriaceae bacterium]|jgi:hypothetical protein|nr:hypothetical protein [Acidobacteriaceae bacterium]